MRTNEDLDGLEKNLFNLSLLTETLGEARSIQELCFSQDELVKEFEESGVFQIAKHASDCPVEMLSQKPN